MLGTFPFSISFVHPCISKTGCISFLFNISFFAFLLFWFGFFLENYIWLLCCCHYFGQLLVTSLQGSDVLSFAMPFVSFFTFSFTHLPSTLLLSTPPDLGLTREGLKRDWS